MSRNIRNIGRSQTRRRSNAYRRYETPAKKAPGAATSIFFMGLVIVLMLLLYISRNAIWQALAPRVNELGHAGILLGIALFLIALFWSRPRLQVSGVVLMLVGGLLASLTGAPV